MSVSRVLLLVPVIFVLAGALFLYTRTRGRDAAEAPSEDPAVRQVVSLNPGLKVEQEFARVPVYWVSTDGSPQKLMLPISEVEGAQIKLRPCDLGGIPPALLYPNRLEIGCAEMVRDGKKLNGYFFRTNDRLKNVVGFFEASLEPNRRLGTSRSNVEERREEKRGPDGSKEFFFSYLLWQAYDVRGFVGYSETKE